MNCEKHKNKEDNTLLSHFDKNGCFHCFNDRNKISRAENFFKKAIQKHGNKFDYSLTEYGGRHVKVKIICPFHGEFIQRPSDHLKHDCYKCFREKRANGVYRAISIAKISEKQCSISSNELIDKGFFKNQFLAKVVEKFGTDKFDYSHATYVNNQTKCKIFCKKHQIFFNQLPDRHLEGRISCQECLKEQYKSRAMSFDYFLTKAKEKHGAKYDYSLVSYVNTDSPVKIICPIHGIFEQPPIRHYYSGCKKCATRLITQNNKLTNEEFITRSKEIHKDKFTYEETDFKGVEYPVKISCKQHGLFEASEAQKHLVQDFGGCYKCFIKGRSLFYEHILTLLRNKKVKFKERDRGILRPKEIDVYFPEAKVGIEFNGDYWHSEFCNRKGKKQNYHFNKFATCLSKDVSLIQLSESAVKSKCKKTLNTILSGLNIQKYTINATICGVENINSEIKSLFLNKYHISGDIESNFNIGFYHKNRLVGVIACKELKQSVKILRVCSVYNFQITSYKSIIDFIKEKTRKDIFYVQNNLFPVKINFGSCKLNYFKNVKPKPHYFHKHYKETLSEKDFILYLKNQNIYNKQHSLKRLCIDNKWNRIWDAGKTIYKLV